MGTRHERALDDVLPRRAGDSGRPLTGRIEEEPVLDDLLEDLSA